MASGPERCPGRRESRPGIYVHFPWCVHRCAYCDYPARSGPPPGWVAPYGEAILAELRLRAAGSSPEADSVYLGGGTPSLWPIEALERILAAVAETPGLRADAEVTLEANPADVDPERVARWRAAGINRVVLGAQALHDERLHALDRDHDAATAQRAAATLAASGLASWSVDLMAGVPGGTAEGWHAELARLVELGPPHVSVLGLQLEPGGEAAARMRARGTPPPGAEVRRARLEAAAQHLATVGYEALDPTGYARPGHAGRHQAGTWRGRPRIGLGAGAHGFDPPWRWRNPDEPGGYLAALRQGDPAEEREHLDATTRALERWLLALHDLREGAPADGRVVPGEAVAREREAGLLEHRGGRIRATSTGRWALDAIVERLLEAALTSSRGGAE